MRRVIVMVVGLGALLAACSGSEPAIELAEGSSGPDSRFQSGVTFDDCRQPSRGCPDRRDHLG